MAPLEIVLKNSKFCPTEFLFVWYKKWTYVHTTCTQRQ